MVRMSWRFPQFLTSLIEVDNVVLHPNLGKIVALGLTIGVDHVLITGMAPRKTNASSSDFPDDTGYECFMNQIHIGDALDEGDQIPQAGRLVRDLFMLWRGIMRDEYLNAIVAIDEDLQVVVRFHKKRRGQSWLSDDFDKYEDAVLEVSSKDLLFT